MPYLEHPNAITPGPDTVIWRYMDLPKFLMLLEYRALYFSLLSELDDKWEAVIDRKMTRSVANVFAPSVSGNVISTFQGFNKNVVVNCWYCGEEESVAMWALYTSTVYGVAIRSSVRQLQRAVGAATEDIFLGTVEYRDHDDASGELYGRHDITPLKAVLQKRVCYKHECELRAFTDLQPEFPNNPQPGAVFFSPFPEQGKLVNVNLRELILSVTLGPKETLIKLSLSTGRIG